MRDFVIMTDSSCDLPAWLAEELGVQVLPLHFQIENQTYKNWLDGREMDIQTFYQQIRQGAMPKTSAVNVGEMTAGMQQVLDSGRDILFLSFSSALSATYQSAVIAAKDLSLSYPNASIRVVDTLCASMGQGLLVTLCVRQKQQGRTMEEVAAYAEERRLHICHHFTADDLHHLQRGGRVSAAAALFGTMLSVKPALRVDNNGALEAIGKVRGRKAALLDLVDRMEPLAQDDIQDQTVYISHSDCREDAELVAEEVRRRFGTRDILIHYIGPVIGSHTGVGTVALFFQGKER